jgi:hypothetical protein
LLKRLIEYKKKQIMKRIIFGAVIALALASCGGEEPVEEVVAPTIDSTAIVNLEVATGEVELGVQSLETSVNKMNADVDSLLNGI